MSAAHLALAWLALATDLAVVVIGALTAAGRLRSYSWVDRAILGQLGTTIAAVAAGLVLPVVGPPPADPLHFVYAAVAVAGVPVARAIARDGPTARLGRFVLVGGVVVLGALLRLFMTGR